MKFKKLRELLDKSLSRKTAMEIYINSVIYKIYRGRIICISYADGSKVTNKHQLFNETVAIYAITNS